MSDESSGIVSAGQVGRTPVSRAATLEGFVEEAMAGAGVALPALEPLTMLVVETRNTHYRILVSRAAEIVIQGGTYFPHPTRAQLDGASLGTSLLRLGWIGIGMRMEIRDGQRRIVTTPVRSIARIDAAASGPH